MHSLSNSKPIIYNGNYTAAAVFILILILVMQPGHRLEIKEVGAILMSLSTVIAAINAMVLKLDD